MLATSTLLLPGAPACATRRSLPASSRVAPPTQRPQQRAGRLLARAEGQDNSEQATQQPPAESQQQQQKAQEEEPIWVRRERERAAQKESGARGDLPFGAYLLFSSFTAIAAVGSIFEYVNQRPIFDAIQPDSPLYLPILGFFAVTGVPTSGFLFYKSVQAANAEAERMDKLDGY